MLFLLLLIVRFQPIKGQDPCMRENYKIVNEPERSMRYTVVNAANIACDQNMANGWYRVNSSAGTTLASSCPGQPYVCNTFTPIWIRGTIPDAGFENLVEGCPYFSGDCCPVPLTGLRIKNCTDFLVYYLIPVPGCNAAYCAGSKFVCTRNASEEVPCSELYPQVYTLPTADYWVNGELQKDVFFACFLSQPVPRDDLNRGVVYEVKWLIFGHNDSTLPDPILNVNDFAAYLSEKQLKQHLGTNISCMANVRYIHLDEKSPWMTSNDYYAGIVLDDAPDIVLTFDKPEQIQAHLTVPIACDIADIGKCEVDFNIRITNNNTNKVIQQDICEEGILQNIELAFHDGCSSSLSRNSWQTESLIWNVSVRGSNLYKYTGQTQNYSLYVWVANNAIATLWNGTEFFLAHVSSAYDDHISGICVVTSGIRIITLKDKLFSQYSLGEFTLYKYQLAESKIEVRYISKECDSVGACICAVVISDATETVVIDKCRRSTNVVWLDKTYPNRKFETRVYKKNNSETANKLHSFDNGIRFQYILSNGGYVEAVLTESSFMTILLHLSPLSEINSSGICFTNSDDLLRWRINSSQESLFYGPVNNSSIQNLTSGLICSCNGYNCDQMTPVETCSEKKALQPCQLGRCSLSLWPSSPDDDYPIDFTLTYNAVNASWPSYDWSQSDAEANCSDMILSSIVAETCNDLQVIHILAQNLTTLCIENIKDTGKTARTQELIEILRLTCRRELRWNLTLWEENSGTYYMSTERLKKLCPGNCSSHGICMVDGKCQCDSGFMSNDCSLASSRSSVINYITNNGLYDYSGDNSIVLVGKGFLDSASLSCVFKAEINQEFVNDAIYLSNDTIKCNLPQELLENPDSIVNCLVSTINRDENYTSNEMLLVLYNSTCYNCTGSGNSLCTIQQTVCIIDNSCYGAGVSESNPEDTCSKCVPTINQTSWTLDPECVNSYQNTWIIVTVTIIAVGGICAAGIIIYINRKKLMSYKCKNKRTKVEHGSELQ